MFVRIGAAAALALCASAAVAGELGWSDYSTGEPEMAGIVSLSGGIGVVALEANEYVYAAPGSDTLMSHLIWQSTAPMLSAGVDVRMPEGWTLAAKAQVAMAGDSYMEDYDWIDFDGPGGPFEVDYGADNWTDRSQHDDTNLDWYFNGSLLVGYDMPVSEGMRVNLNGGLKYTDVQWAAYGGSFVYSDVGYRDWSGEFADGEPGISYRQTFPALVAGIDGEITDGPWTVTGSAQVGATFYAQGDDHHWMRDLNFVDRLNSAPLASVGASVSYEVGDGLSVFVEGTAEQIFTARADTDVYDIPTGDLEGTDPDGAGGDLFAASISGGIKGSF